VFLSHFGFLTTADCEPTPIVQTLLLLKIICIWKFGKTISNFLFKFEVGYTHCLKSASK
jgi:hypothetical protein